MVSVIKNLIFVELKKNPKKFLKKSFHLFQELQFFFFLNKVYSYPDERFKWNVIHR